MVSHLYFLILITEDDDAHSPGQVTAGLVKPVQAPLQSHRHIESPEFYKIKIKLKYTS